MSYPIIRRILPLTNKIIFKKIKGLKNLPSDGPYIVASNHLTPFDGIYISSIIIPRIKNKIHFLARKSKLLKVKILGDKIIQHWTGCIFVDPQNKKESLYLAYYFLKKKEVIGVFPEGTGTTGKYLLKGKTGVARLALWSKAPIIPIGIRTKPVQSNQRALLNLLTRKKIEILIGKPMTFSQYYNRKINRKILNKITKKVMKELAKLANKIYRYSPSSRRRRDFEE